MTVENEKQYRPITIRETGYQNPLSVRYLRDMASNINNFKSKVCNHKLISDNWTIENDMMSWTTAKGLFRQLSWSDEHIRMPYAPRYVPDGYSRLIVQSMHHRVRGAGAITWRLHVVRRFNNTLEENTFPVTYGEFNTNQFCEFIPGQYPEIRTAEWTTTSDSLALSAQIMNCDLRDRRSQFQLILTSQNSEQDTDGRLLSLDVTPILGT